MEGDKKKEPPVANNAYKKKVYESLKLFQSEIPHYAILTTFYKMKGNSISSYYYGIIYLTNFRFIFGTLENFSEKYKEDYFYIPYLLIKNINSQSLTYNNVLILELKDGRTLQFNINDNLSIFFKLNEKMIKKTNAFDFPLLFNNYLKNKDIIKDGWKIYDLEKEFKRQGLTFNDSCPFKISSINKGFRYIATYPELLIEPKNINDKTLIDASYYRNLGRIPTLSYYYNNLADDKGKKKLISGIWLSSDCKVGFFNNKNDQDINLINEIQNLGNKLFIYDARSKKHANANKIIGGGYENVDNYQLKNKKKPELIFCNIGNVDDAQKALNNLQIIFNDENLLINTKFLSQLEKSEWPYFICTILKRSREISQLVSKGNNVLIHCTKGWDRTPQLVAISEILLDPYYRTFEGFAVLIEKDFLSFGHQFARRNGLVDIKEEKPDKKKDKKKDDEDEKEEKPAPIFLQFLDCVYQLILQFPSEFEFNSEYLLFIAKNYNVNIFGTFLFDNEKERNAKKAQINTASIWTYLLGIEENKAKYANASFKKDNAKRILKPNYALYKYKLWKEYFLKKY